MQCRCRIAGTGSQKMASLPEERLIPGYPFEYTGVDYLGPYLVKVRRSPEKRWICLFTCMKIRAVHLEVAYELSSSAFINCLSCFVARQPGVRHMFSDNGTNFVGVNKELISSLSEWSREIDVNQQQL